MYKKDLYQKMDFIGRNSIYGTMKNKRSEEVDETVGFILYFPVISWYCNRMDAIVSMKINQHQLDLKDNTISFMIDFGNKDTETFTNEIRNGILNHFDVVICIFNIEMNHKSSIICSIGKVLSVSIDENKQYHITFECNAFTDITDTIKGKEIANFLKIKYQKEKRKDDIYKMEKKIIGVKKPVEITIRSDEIFDYDIIDKFVKENFRYQARYFYEDLLTIRDSDWRIIAAGNDKNLLEQYCISKGFTKSEKMFDGGYEILDKNPNIDIDPLYVQKVTLKNEEEND